MGGHHKKNLRAEKAKVKLKGAKLPKGLNVTKTDFKVRKIAIREQLRGDAGAGKVVNLKEVLSKLKHHGTNFRTEALRNLREAVVSGHSDLQRQLGAIVAGVAAASLDVEKEPRRESFKTLNSLLGTLDVDTVAPFFHVVSSYLRCAMTHIQPQLQKDSLLMLDVLLQHVPQLVAAHSEKILQNFLELISRVSSEGVGSGVRRALSAVVDQKETSVHLRAQVLQRLQHMLQTLVEHQKRLQRTEGGNSAKNLRCLSFNAKETQYFVLRRALWSTQLCDVDLASMLCHKASAARVADDKATLRSHISHLFPLLQEAWLEVRPTVEAGLARNAQVLLSAEAALTLQSILEVISHLWQLVVLQESDLGPWLRQEYAESFAVNFLLIGAYPYQQTPIKVDGTKKGKRGKVTAAMPPSATTTVDIFCATQNLELAQLMAQFYVGDAVKRQRNKFAVLLEYLNVIVHKLPRGQQRTSVMETALRAYLLVNGHALLQLEPEQIRALLQATIDLVLNSEQDGSSHDGRTLLLLCDIIQMPDLFAAYGAAMFEAFLAHLPQMLLQSSIGEPILLAMSSLGKQQNSCFLQALSVSAMAIVGNLQSIHVTGAANTFEGKKHILNLFYWTEPQWRAEKGAEMLSLMAACVTDKRVITYASFILTQQ